MSSEQKRRKPPHPSGFGAKSDPGHEVPSLKLDSLILPLIDAGRYQDACQQLNLMRQSKSRNPQVYVLLGLVYSYLGDISASVDAYEIAIALDPKRVDALVNLANTFAKSGRFNDAARVYETASSVDSSDPSLLFNYANFLLANDMYSAACRWLERWLSLEPGNAVALKMQGYCLSELDQLDYSRQLLQKSLEVSPGDPEALAHLASTELRSGYTELSLSYASKAYSQSPDSVPINLVYGVICLAAARWESALKAFSFVSENSAGLVRYQALYNSAFAYFGLGQRRLGYCHLEHRFKVPSQYQPHMYADYTIFDPSQPGRSLALVSEQGFGDTIQFSRYASWLISAHGFERIILYVQAELVQLLRRSMPEVGVFYHGDSPNPLPFSALPLASCPYFFGENQSDASLHRPYLFSSPALLQAWSSRLRAAHPSDVLVGICWQGNPAAERSQNRGRSIPLLSLLKFADLPGIRLVSLQKSFGLEQLTPELSDRYFVDCQSEISNSLSFEDSAAIIDSCDLMITTDTGPAHLCGALGKPLWLLLSHCPDWRWGADGQCNFWYSNLSIFQQPKEGDWGSVIVSVRQRLAHCMSTREFSF